MAIVLNEQDKEQQRLAQQTQTQGAPAGGQAIGGQSAAAPTAAGKPRGSGLFTNLQRYIDANQGNQAVSGAVNEIGQKADDAQNQFNQAQGQLNSMQATPTDYSQQQREVDQWQAGANRALSSAAEHVERMRTFNNGSNLQNALDAQEATKQDLERQRQGQFKKVSGWLYGGTQESDVNSTYQKAEEARQGAEKTQGLVGNADTRAEYLKDKYNAGRGDYSSGQGRLDNFLVGNAGRDTFATKSAGLQQAAGQRNTLQQTRDSVTGQIAGARSSVDNQREEYFQRLRKFVI